MKGIVEQIKLQVNATLLTKIAVWTTNRAEETGGRRTASLCWNRLKTSTAQCDVKMVMCADVVAATAALSYEIFLEKRKLCACISRWHIQNNFNIKKIHCLLCIYECLRTKYKMRTNLYLDVVNFSCLCSGTATEKEHELFVLWPWEKRYCIYGCGKTWKTWKSTRNICIAKYSSAHTFSSNTAQAKEQAQITENKQKLK